MLVHSITEFVYLSRHPHSFYFGVFILNFKNYSISRSAS